MHYALSITPLRSAKHLERAHSSLELVESLKLIVDIAKTLKLDVKYLSRDCRIPRPLFVS
jgi:hypothetical protein